MKKFKLWLVLLLLAAAIANLLTVSFLIKNNRFISTSAPNDNAYLKITVIDVFSKLPLEAATICIPETGTYYTTDNFGRTSTIIVPFLPNVHYDNINKRNWGDITILVYKEGYIDYLVFYIMVQQNKIRNLTLTLAPLDINSQPYIIIESPDQEWAKEVINKYKK